MEDKKDFVVEIRDNYSDNLADGLANKRCNKPERPKGYVEIYEKFENGDKKLIDKNNLVVYMGREWLVSRAFDAINENIDPQPEEFIGWFGVGDGGCPIGDPMNPTSPANTNTDLDNSIMINSTDLHCGDYRLTPDEGFYKHPFDELTFVQDPDNYNYWLTIKVSTTLGADDANSFNISEAGLFTAESSDGGFAGPFHLYARVTFPSIMKTNSRQLMFIWYVFF